MYNYKVRNRMIAVALMGAMLINGCGVNNISKEVTVNSDTSAEEESYYEETSENSELLNSNDETLDVGRKTFLGEDEILYNPDLVPSANPVVVAPDFSNIINREDYISWIGKEKGKALIRDGFFIDSAYGNDEFFDAYEYNRYCDAPNFITVDSLMHTYHLYFAYLLKNTERTYLNDTLANVTEKMLKESIEQCDALKGTEWENAAARNVAYFGVPAKILGVNVSIPGYAVDTVDKEYGYIDSAEGIEESPISGVFEDYSQYKPRGYYGGDELLEKYFKAMMWYGRISFINTEDDMNRSALLMTQGMKKCCLDEWESVYLITSFFAGAADDCGYYEYDTAVCDAYGELDSITDIVGNSEGFDKYSIIVKNMKAPQINSIPVWENEDNVITSFRFMGQRFSVDEAMFTKLISPAVGENSNGVKRYLPDTLDVAAALGSEAAYDVLNSQGDTDYSGYNDNLMMLEESFNNADDSLWNASLYSNWINTLRPLLEKKGEGYPMYQQSEKWALKNLETFAGSYAELKHDTILYTKQVAAEMGGGDEEKKDDRGYVDPEPVVYSRFANLAAKTRKGLEYYNMLDDNQNTCLNLLYDMAVIMLNISEKELQNIELTDEEYEFIRCYGGALEHFWLEVNNEEYSGGMYMSDLTCPIIADIATDPNGSVLEVGTGKAQTIYVVVEVAGRVKIASGSVYSFYQFPYPMSDRLTDFEWKKMLGGWLDENYEYHDADESVKQPEWTQSYRIVTSFAKW